MSAPVLGLTHLALAVADLDRAVAFYSRAFGCRENYRDADSVQVTGPGPHDIIAFQLDPASTGAVGGIGHFGFRLATPEAREALVDLVGQAGGKLLRIGQHDDGSPYAYVADPDGYEIELRHEATPPHVV